MRIIRSIDACPPVGIVASTSMKCVSAAGARITYATGSRGLAELAMPQATIAIVVTNVRTARAIVMGGGQTSNRKSRLTSCGWRLRCEEGRETLERIGSRCLRAGDSHQSMQPDRQLDTFEDQRNQPPSP